MTRICHTHDTHTIAVLHEEFGKDEMLLIPAYAALTPAFREFINDSQGSPSTRFVADLFFAAWSFDESYYLSKYPDIAEALPKSTFLDAYDHFRTVGYSEGRFPVIPRVDAPWYMKAYPDVAAAIINGHFRTAEEHYLVVGYKEGRLNEDPNVDTKWYVATYLRQSQQLGDLQSVAVAHFVDFGYRNGAIPRFPEQ